MIEISYNFVFCTRYRFKLFKNNESADIIKGIFLEVAKEMKMELSDFSYGVDYVMVNVKTNKSTISPNQIAYSLRGNTSATIRENEMLNLNHMPSIWIRDVIISTSKIEHSTIDSFLSLQKKRS